MKVGKRNMGSALVLFFTVVISTSSATTYVVNPEGTGDFPTIDDALDAAAEGDTVALTDGTFTGWGNIGATFPPTSVTLKSQNGPDACTIDSETYGAIVLSFVADDGHHSTMEGVTIVNGTGILGAALNIDDASPTIRNCVLRDNEVGSKMHEGRGAAAYMIEADSTHFIDCTFHHNGTFYPAPGGSGGAVFCSTAVDLVFDGCIFTNNYAQHGAGIYLIDASAQITNCTFHDQWAGPSYGLGPAIYLESCDATIDGCTFAGNMGQSGGGVYCMDSSPTIIHCTFSDHVSDSGAIRSAGASIPVIIQTIIANGSWTAVEGPATLLCCDLYGNSGGDWVDDIADQYGVNGNISYDPLFCDAENRDFHLAENSPCAPFSPPNDECDLIGDWPVGCDPVVTQVCGDGSGDYLTIQEAIDGAAPGAIIELCDGYYTGPGNRDIDFLGKHITVRSGSRSAEDCIVDCGANASEPHRGFLFDSGEGEGSVLQGVTIRNGYIAQGGGVYINGSSPTLADLTFTNNHATDDGGAIYATDGAQPAVIDCRFFENSADDNGGGVYFNQAPGSMEGSVFRGNTAVDAAGGFGIAGPGGTVEDCVFYDNYADGGGALFSHGYCTVIFSRCTVYGNSAAVGGGAIFRHYSLPTLENCIISFGTEGGSVECTSGSNVVLSCCDVYGNAGGDYVGCIEGMEGLGGNISVDPLFCDAIAEDFTLQADSPCAEENNMECGQIGALPIGCIASTDIALVGVARGRASIQRVYPNPSTSEVTIVLEIPEAQSIKLDVFDVAGRFVRTLVAGRMVAGQRVANWDGRSVVNRLVPPGIYYIRLEARGLVITRRMTFLR